MAIEVVGLVLRARTGLGTQAKMVLLGLADHAHADGREARPGVRTLAQYAECSERTVQRHLRSLEDAGFISLQRAGGGRNPKTYAISLPELAALRPAPRGDSVSSRPSELGGNAQVTRATGQRVTTETGQPVTPEPSGDTAVTAGVTNPAPRGDTAVSPEPSLSSTVSEPSKTSAAAPRDRDEVWDDLEEIFGTPVNDADSSRRERAAKLCRQAGWSDGELLELRGFADRDSRSWVTSLAATDMALAVNLGRLRILAASAGADDDSAVIERVRDRVAAAGGGA